MTETRQYDADGRLVADITYYAPGTKVTVKNPDGTFQMGIGGWLASANTYYYDAAGQVTATYDYSRWNVNWNAISTVIDNDRLDPSTEINLPPVLSADAAAAGNAWGVLARQNITLAGNRSVARQMVC